MRRTSDGDPHRINGDRGSRNRILRRRSLRICGRQVVTHHSVRQVDEPINVGCRRGERGEEEAI